MRQLFLLIFAFVCVNASAQSWVQTWGQHPLTLSEFAGYASQSNMAALPGYGAFVWENYRDDVNVFSDAGYNYQWQNGVVSYPWGAPLWRCQTGTWNTSGNRWVLSAAIDAVTTSIATNATWDIDSGAVYGAGVYLLIDQEVLELIGYNSTSKILTVNRGALGTTAAAHSNTNTWSGRFSYICQLPYENNIAAPQSNWPNVAPAIRHPNGDIVAGPGNKLYVGGGIHESYSGYDLWAYDPVTGNTSFATGTVPPKQESAMIFDSDDQVIINTTGSVNGSSLSQDVELFCAVANPAVGCNVAGQFNQVTTGKTTTYVSNPTAGPQLSAMRGTYDALHHAAIFWGGTQCVSLNTTCENSTNTSVYLLLTPQATGTGKWAWLKLPNDGIHQVGNLPIADWRPAITWDSFRNRVLVVEPTDGAIFSGVWDGNQTWTWTNLNIAAGPVWPRWFLDYPYMAYVSEHDGIVLTMMGAGNPKSLAAWELSFGGTP